MQLESRPKEPATSADAEDIQQELQDAHAAGGESNSSMIELQDVNDWTFWKVRPPPKRKKDVWTT
jgi:hypothetical protein